MDNAPGPAPSSRNMSSHYDYPSTSRPRTLTRQHRSVDMVAELSDYGAHGYSNLSATEPLAVSTQFHQPSSNFYNSRGAAPLSNPIPSNQAFWNSSNPIPSYRDDVDMSRNTGFNIEYNQLKADYQSAIDKLNQTMNSIKTFWSPELKKERQMRREEATRIAQLEHMLSSGRGGMPSNDVTLNQLKMEIAERDEKIRQMSSFLEESNMSSGNNYSELKIQELLNTIAHLEDLLKTKDQHVLGQQTDAASRHAMENALRRLDDKQARINELEMENCRMRSQRSSQPRDFTDKSVSNHDVITLRMKMERSELELNERKAELANCQTRMRTAEEQASEMRNHLQVLKDQITNREQQSALLQGDVEALRSKLEAKNEQMTQKVSRIEKLEKELITARGDVQDRSDQARQSELRTSQLVGRIEALEANLREKEQELDKAKIRLLSHPDVIKEKSLMEKIEQNEREKHRLQEHIDQLRRNSEKDRLEQQESYQKELRAVQTNLDNLQKELLDRDVLLESQNEKIGDLSRELTAAHKRLQDSMVDKGADELKKEVENARNEVEKLLKMVHQLEKDNSQLNTQCKQLQGVVDNRQGSESGKLMKNDRLFNNTNSSVGTNASTAMKKRVEELEEALRESVSITAEREVHLSQQKHLLQQVNAQLSEARRELSEVRKNSGSTTDRDQLLRTIEAERRQHLDQLFQLKQEAILAAINEKDAHLALLEKGRAPMEEIETLRRHKEALMRKLKSENERRALVSRPESAPLLSNVGPGALVVNSPIPHPMPDVMAISAEDDAEGIWA